MGPRRSLRVNGYENVIMGVLAFFVAAPVLFLATAIGVGLVRALRDGIWND